MSQKAAVLIVDDELGPRESLKMVLKPFYQIYSAENGERALEIIRKHPIDLVTLDLKMPGMSGTDTLREIKKINDQIEVIIITGFGSLKTAMEGIRYGAADYLLKPFDIAELVSIVNRTLEHKQLNDRLNAFIAGLGKLIDLEADLSEVRKMLSEKPVVRDHIKGVFQGSLMDETLSPEERPLMFAKSLTEILEAEGSYSTCHSKRVAHYSHLMALQLNLGAKQLLDLQLGAYLHDIGAVGLDRRLLPKEGIQSEEDHHKLMRHTEIGSELIAPLGFSPEVTYIIRHHHEHFDGTGSPEGLKGEEIPILARIVAIAEAFDEMLSRTVDHEPQPLKQAAQTLKEESGRRFDPRLVDTFIKIIEEKKDGLLPKHLESRATV